MNTIKLQELRKNIDSLDEELLAVLAKRMEAVKEIGKLKKADHLPPFDEKRWKEMLEARLVLGKKCNLSSEFVKELYEIIHQHSLEVEQR